jgi:heavy metal-binding protein
MNPAALLVALALALAVNPAAAPQTAKAVPQGESLPPLSWTCPMHPEILEDKKGSCPICKMDLVPIRLENVWTCATRPLAVIEARPGKCAIDGSPLVQVTATVSWTCKDQPAINANEPGTCPDGSRMTKRYSPRAHGNHNPQHGGQFFMAPDNSHHLEGTLPRAGVFRVYMYNDFTKPLPLADFKGVKGRLITSETFDSATKTTKDVSVPLVPVRSGRYLEAKIGRMPLPAKLAAKISFKPDAKEDRFDFTFESYSKEPGVTAAPTITSAAPAPAPTAIAFSPAAAELSSGVDPALIPLPIPDAVPEILTQLRTRTDQIRVLIDRGSFGSIYVPAFQAKDLAVALDAHTNELPAERRKIAEPALTRLVRSAYLLDAFGDLGNKQQIALAYAKFVEAAKDIQSAFPQQP